MANKNIKALVIKVNSSSEPGGIEYKWDSLTSRMPSFTNDIITPALSVDKDGKSEVNIGAIVSGMPTVFARANMFINALNAVSDKAAKVEGLLGFYKSLIDEWRGFISCIALDYKEIKVKRIYLTYSDGKRISETENIYEPKGAFGNVLFERAPLWSDQSKSANSDNPPFIDVILYKGKVVGGTSPESFLFTSVAYQLDAGEPFVDIKSRNFTDPHKDLSPEQLNILYGYVKFIINNIENFRKQFDALDNLLKPNFGNVQGNLQDWVKEMETYAISKGFKINEQIPELTSFEKPFSTLFNHSTILYGSEGTISSDPNIEGAILFDPKNLLLSEGTDIAQIDFGYEGAKNKDFLKNRAIYILQAETKGEKGLYNYFALPLTPLALDVFGKNIGALIGVEENNVKSRIIAEYDPNTDELEVTLKLYITSSDSPINKTQKYNVGKELKNQDILLWPNFISKKWGKYFMYSELPHNDDKYRATPFVGNIDDDYFRIVTDENNIPLYLSENGKIKPITSPILKDKVKAKLHIVSDNRVSDNKYKYEIYESNLPFKGIKFSYGAVDCGFAIIRYGINSDSPIKNKLQDIQELSDANLGIDFGSTNTSVAYYSKKYQEVSQSITFKNRRVSLFSSDDKNNDVRPAVEDEIFFFQNDEIKSNAIKSILTIHDFKRLVKGSESQSNESLVSQAVKGGFPCFEKNLPIEDANDSRIFLNYPNAGRVEIVQNMKWSNQDIENSYKTAYLSSLLLHIYAQLFEEGHKPVNLKWSYPSAMSNNLIRQYIQIWTKLGDVNPLTNESKLEVYTPETSMNISNDSSSTWGSSNQSVESSWGTAASTEQTSSWGEPEPSVPSQTGWGSNQTSEINAAGNNLKDINTQLGPIDFNFKILPNNKSLTESCAVANYIANSGNVSTDLRYLTICFDVGGSTTDIMALCNMMGPEGMHLAMVKQNSIRFAAQRVAQATKHSPNFKAVMIEMCDRKKISIQGLNKGDNKFSANTAPYYFEQLVDRLDDSDFDSFYQLLAGKCPELMCVNLYVTGLIMYYAGQIASKLRTEVNNSPNKLPGMDNWKPIVNIIFAGKGARIFDWLKANNPQNSKEYYETLFVKGYGGMALALQTLGGPPNINPTNNDGSNIKYEVSKGLAQTTQKLYVPQNNTAIEILGEDNFIIFSASGQQLQIKSEDSITPEMMESIGSHFLSSPPAGGFSCPKFMEFADIYFKIANGMFGLPLTQKDFLDGFNNMNIGSYIKQLPEYKMAQESKQRGDSEVFDFIAPIIILEGMKFLEDVIYKKISNL